MTPTIGSLCTGYGGLDQAAQAITGGTVRWHSEIDPAANEILEAHHPDIPNIGDMTTAEPDPVDILIGGFPCQPFSQAGKREGTADDRWLWPAIMRLVDAQPAPPGMLLLENVPGLLSVNEGAAWAEIRSDLTARGYITSHLLLRASDVGACHQRRRLFILARHADTSLPFIPPLDLAPKVAGRTLPTPAAWDGARGPDLARANRPNSGGMDLVTTAERLLPTPTASESTPTDELLDEIAEHHQGQHRLYLPGRASHSQRTLSRTAPLFPTPNAADSWVGDVNSSPEAIELQLRRGDPNGSRRTTTGSLSKDIQWKLPPLFPTPMSRDHKGADPKATPETVHLPRGKGGTSSLPDVTSLLPTPTASDASGSRRNSARQDHWTSYPGTTLGDVAYAEQFGDYAEPVARHAQIVGRPPPAPTDDKRRLNPAFVEWMMMLPEGWVTGTGLARRHQLRILGNGVVPLQAATAYTRMSDTPPLPFPA